MAALIALAAIGLLAVGIFARGHRRGQRGHPPGGTQPHPDQPASRHRDPGRALARKPSPERRSCLLSGAPRQPVDHRHAPAARRSASVRLIEAVTGG
jgi:hypothetical protein